MGKISWIQNDSKYTRMEGDVCNVETLPFGIYSIGFNPFSGWFLTKTADKFVFNHKIYNLQNNFLDYVCKSYYNTTGNLGVLLWGHRGSGKTISAKVLANILEQPIIIVKSMGDNNDALLEYISSFNFDCVLFFDEFEKQFDADDPFILQLMDGVYNSQYRKVFLLTTNELNINENLLSRPSRIRYVREFGNLPKEVVLEYLNDNLKDKCCIQELLDYIDTLTISTIDIIKSIVEEVNIHGPNMFLEHKDFFNVQTANYDYQVVVKEFYKYGRKDIDSKSILKDLTDFAKQYQIKEDFRLRIKKAANDEEVNRLEDELADFENRMDNIYYDNVKSKVIWNKLKPGMTFNNYMVKHVDLEHCVVIGQEGNYTYIWLIQNPNVKPSLYNNNIVPTAFAF